MSESVNREKTFGEKAVGVDFNPGGSERVKIIKETCAAAIDVLNNERESIKHSEDDGQNGERIAQLTLAIRKIQEGQMWGVKAVTWNPGR